jgi:hypothetical protein
MKFIGHWDPIFPSAAHKPAAAAAAASRPQVNFVFSQMGMLQKILELNGIYGPPPKQPIHNSRLRAGLRSLCKYNFDRKDYSNHKTKKNKILAKSTMARFTKSTKKMERKPDENANANGSANATMVSAKIKPREAKPATPAPLLDKTASSESFSANSNGNVDALLVSTGTKPSGVEPAPLASFVNETASSEDIYFDASDKKIPSEEASPPTNALVTESVAAAIFVCEKTNETKSEKKLAPRMPSVFKTASSDFSNHTNAPVATPPEAKNKTDSKVKPVPTTPPVSETASSSATVNEPYSICNKFEVFHPLMI